MKYIFLFSTFCLVAKAQLNYEVDETVRLMEKNNLRDRLIQGVSTCAREVSKKFSKTEDLRNNTEAMTCMLACGLRQLTTRNFENDLHQQLLGLVRIAYDHDFQSTEFTRKDIESKIDNCFKKAGEECEQFNCVDHKSSPVADILDFNFGLFAKGFYGQLLREIVESDNWQKFDDDDSDDYDY